MGKGNTIGPFVVIMGPVVLGDDNWIGTGTIIGAPPEVRNWDHPKNATPSNSGNGIVIGSRNVLREYSQVHQGWHQQTRLGDDIFVMNQTYIAHDCIIGNRATLASSVLLGGHTVIGAGANLGLGANVHQRSYVGEGAMVGMGSVVTRNVPPFAKAYGNPARVHGANAIGMERAGMTKGTISATTAAYSEAYDESLSALEGLPELEAALRAWRSQ